MAEASNLDGITGRYEDLNADPIAVAARLCDFLGVPCEEGRLDCRGDQRFVNGLGD